MQSYEDAITNLSRMKFDLNFIHDIGMFVNRHLQSAFEIGRSIVNPDVQVARFKFDIAFDLFPANEIEFLTTQAFSVAHITSEDLIEQIRGELIQARKFGISYKMFVADLDAVFLRSGYATLQPFHLETVFIQNLTNAFQAGKFGELSQPEVQEAFPFWQYITLDDGHVRPTHQAMNGFVAKAGDPIWQTWYPPNGYRCRCDVEVLTAEEAAELDIQDVQPSGFPVEEQGISKVPAGARPDKGFDRAPSKSMGLEAPIERKLIEAPKNINTTSIPQSKPDNFKRGHINKVFKRDSDIADLLQDDAKRVGKDLSDREAALQVKAVQDYMRDDSLDMRKAQHLELIGKVADVTKFDRNLGIEVENFISNSPAYKGDYIGRGISLDLKNSSQKKLLNQLENSKKGDIYFDGGTTSWSSEQDVIKRYGNLAESFEEKNSATIIFQSRDMTSRSTSVSHVSNHTDDAEILVSKVVKWKIIKTKVINYNNGGKAILVDVFPIED